MKVRYLLKKKGKKGSEFPIYVALYDNDETEIISTGQRCLLKDWSADERAPKDHDGDLFTAIEKVKSDVMKVKKRMEVDELPVTPFALKEAYLKSQKQKGESQQKKDKQDKGSKTSIPTLIDKWIKDGLTEYQPSTKKVVITSIKMFKEFLKSNGYPKLERRELDLEVIGEYARYLQEKKKLRDSTHGKKMKHLRWFLKYIKFEAGQISEIKIKSVKPSERNIISLSAAELQALESVDVSHAQELQKAKDMFLLGCYSGWRISDLKRISPHRIKDGEIHLTLQKNRKNVELPLFEQTKKILERYNWSAPKISEQQVNESIKKVCEKAGINEILFFKTVKGGRLIETKHAKHELITSHVAGKTFINLAGDRWGLSPTDIAAIVGKDIKTILGYYLKPDVKVAKQKMIEAENRAQMKAV